MAYRACASSPPPSMLETAFAAAEGETFGSSTTAGTRPRYCRCSAYGPDDTPFIVLTETKVSHDNESPQARRPAM